MCGEKQTFNKINDNLWSKFLIHLEQPNHHARDNTVDRNSILIDTTEANEATTSDENVYTGAPDLANDTDNNDEENDENSNIVVVLSSDSENENETIWSNNYKSKGFTRLWEKGRCLILQRLVRGFPFLKTKDSSYALVNVEDQLFPYGTLQELSVAVRRYNKDNNLNKKELSFLWSNIIQWLTAIKLSPSDPLDLNYDEKFNLIIIDFMIQYINYVTKSYCNATCKDEIQRKINEIIQTMSVIFNGSTSHAIMTLLRIEYKMEYRILLDPILRKYLEDRNLSKTSNDFIVYLRLVFCFKKWKTIIPLKTEREKINEIAIGKISRYQKTDTSIGTEPHSCTENVSILPKSVPKTNVRNQEFALINDLIGFAIKRKDVGTKTLLVYTSLDLDDAITKYFNLYERYITMYTTTQSDDASVMLSQMNIGNSRSSLQELLSTFIVYHLKVYFKVSKIFLSKFAF